MTAPNTPRTPRDAYAIVVGIDFDAPGDHALREAVRAAMYHPTAEIHAVHVITDVPATPRATAAIDRTAALLEQTPAKLRAYVADRLAAMGAPAGAPIVLHTRLGAAAGGPSAAVVPRRRRAVSRGWRTARATAAHGLRLVAHGSRVAALETRLHGASARSRARS